MQNGLDPPNSPDRNEAVNHSQSSPPPPNAETLGLSVDQSHQISSSEVPTRNDRTDGPPAKKRKLADTEGLSRSTSRHISPPWKKVAVDGPTSFVEEGRRKSSRTNIVPLALQPQSGKRQTRAAIQHTSATIKSRYASATTHKSLPVTPSLPKAQVNGKSVCPTQKQTPKSVSQSPSKVQPNGVSTAIDSGGRANFKRSHKRLSQRLSPAPSPPPKPASPPPRRRVGRPRKIVREPTPIPVKVMNGCHNSDRKEEPDNQDGGGDEDKEGEDEEDDDDEDDIKEVPYDPNFKPQRLKFNVRMPTVPIQHPGHVVPPKQFSSLREWLEQDDPLIGTDGTHLNKKEAEKEAQVRQRLAQAMVPGGLLSLDRCSSYIPDPQDEPPQQFSHQDHLIAHALYFRKLMNKEHRDHVATAKKLAYAALSKWKQNQPKTEEEIEKEMQEATDAMYRAKYQQCVRDIGRKWDLLRAEVEKYRLEKWEEEQQALGKQALNRVLKQSAQLLDKRRRRDSVSESLAADDMEGGDDSELREGGSSDSENDGSNIDTEDEKNMSSNGSEVDDQSFDSLADEDDGLTVDEIRRKYAEPPTENLGRPSDVERHQAALSASVTANDDLIDSVSTNESPIPAQRRNRTSSGSRSCIIQTKEPSTLSDEIQEGRSIDDDFGKGEEGSENERIQDEARYMRENKPNSPGFFLENPVGAEMTQDIVIKNTIDDIASDEDVEEVSLIPDTTQVEPLSILDVTQVQTPSASQSETPSTDIQDELKRADKTDCTCSPATSTQLTLVPNDASTDKGSLPTTSLKPCDQPPDIQPESLPATPVSSKALKIQVPSLLRGTLREYQHYGLDWLAGLYANGTNGILADEMGLGKTIQTISLLAHLAVEHEVWGPHLIVVPTSVMLNWEMEFKKFLPGFKILTYYGTQEERRQKRKGWLDDDAWNACITSYQLVLQDQAAFKRRAWHYLVLDEAHNIKNFRSQRWQTLLTFRTRARLLLTGTPLQNNLTELWSLLYFLMPSDDTARNGIPEFADLESFSTWFKRPISQILDQGRETMDDQAKETVRKLHVLLRPFLLRRLKADVEKQMPGKYEHVIYCKLSKRQRYLYDGFMSRAQTRETLACGNYLSIINCLMQLRKVCNHPDLFETRQIVTSFAMPKSAVADYEIKELLVRRCLLYEDATERVNIDLINLLPAANGPVSALDTIQNSRLGALGRLRQLSSHQFGRMLPHMEFDGTSINSTLAFLENRARTAAFESLRHTSYLTSLKSQRRPLLSYGLIDRLTIRTAQCLPAKPIPNRRAQLSDWALNKSTMLESMVLTLPFRAKLLEPVVQKFACITPVVVAPGVGDLTITSRGIEAIRKAPRNALPDEFHEARMRLSIAFPDKRLLQYDCGKLQRLDALLRTLQAGGHRALIFTQMTKVLDILEQFLNIHGHRYLRLDGATKIEQRQILTDRFNNDNRILAFILSSRSGGLGINLTGADTVIFYDLDWNPAMDKQCQDRCHRIGQTRDVHIYRFVSEYTIEANILKKANQKRMLDEVVIQEGDFTTDHLNKPEADIGLDIDESLHEGDAEASAAMDRILGVGAGNDKLSGKIFEQAEDKEDIAAAKVAEKEMTQADEEDFGDKNTGTSSGTPITPATGLATPKNPTPNTPASISGLGQNAIDGFVAGDVKDELLHTAFIVPKTPMAAEIFAEKEGIGVDHYIVGIIESELQDVPVEPPVDKAKKKAKKGADHWGKRAK